MTLHVGRPPVASERLSQLADGRLLYELRHRWRDGTTHVAFEPLELIDRLAALVPPPRFHTVRYHGLLASRSKRRAEVVPKIEQAAGRPAIGLGPCRRGHSVASHSIHPRTRSSDRSAKPASARADSSTVDREVDTIRSTRPSKYYSWPELMGRVFEIDVLQCPRCHASPMRILAAIHPPTTTRAILKALGLPTLAPPIVN